MVESKLSQRFAAFIIDIIIVGLITSIGFRFIASSIDIPTMSDDLISEMGDELKDYYTEYGDEYSFYVLTSGDETVTDEYYTFVATADYLTYQSEFYTAIAEIYGLAFLWFSIVVILYMSVLPAFWDKQTVGRFLVKVKVVGEKDEKVGFAKFFSREYLCGVLLNLLNVCCLGLIFLLNIIFLFVRNRTIADSATKTKLIRYDAEAENIKKEREVKEKASQQYDFNQSNKTNDDFDMDDNEYYVGDEKVNTKNDDND